MLQITRLFILFICFIGILCQQTLWREGEEFTEGIERYTARWAFDACFSICKRDFKKAKKKRDIGDGYEVFIACWKQCVSDYEHAPGYND